MKRARERWHSAPTDGDAVSAQQYGSGQRITIVDEPKKRSKRMIHVDCTVLANLASVEVDNWLRVSYRGTEAVEPMPTTPAELILAVQRLVEELAKTIENNVNAITCSNPR